MHETTESFLGLSNPQAPKTHVVDLHNQRRPAQQRGTRCRPRRPRRCLGRHFPVPAPRPVDGALHAVWCWGVLG